MRSSDRPLRFVLDDFALNAVETIAWLAMAGWLLHLGERRDRVVLRWSGIILFAVATVFAVGWQAIFLNPVMPLFGRPVEGWFLFDSLFLAYAIPAALYAVIGFYRLGPRVLWQAALVLAAGFAFLWVTLEVRHFFQGDRLNQGLTGEAEWYAYSAAWLGLRRGRARGGAQMAQPLAAPGLVARPRPGRRQGVSVRHGRSQRRIAGAFLHRSRRRSGRHRLRLSAAAAAAQRIAARIGSLGALACQRVLLLRPNRVKRCRNRSKRLRQPCVFLDSVGRVPADDRDRHREAPICDGAVTFLPVRTNRQAARQIRRSSRSNIAGIHPAPTTGTDCTLSTMTCTSISSPGAASPLSAAISGATSSTRETSCSKVGASVVNGSSSSEHHHTPASPSHSTGPQISFAAQLATRLSFTLSARFKRWKRMPVNKPSSGKGCVGH